MRRILSILLVIILCLPHIALATSATSQLQEMYAQAELMMVSGQYSEAAELFDRLGSYTDASQMAMYCKAIYAAEDLQIFDLAIDTFQKLGDFKDCAQMAVYYTARSYQAAGDTLTSSEALKIASDSELKDTEKIYDKGIKIYTELALFKDSMKRINECKSGKAKINEEQLTRKEAIYQDALSLKENGEYKEALGIFSSLSDYKDSKDQLTECTYHYALGLENEGNYQEALLEYKSVRDYLDSKDHIAACEYALDDAVYQQALRLEKEGKYQQAIEKYQSISSYRDSQARSAQCKAEYTYQQASNAEKNGDYQNAIVQYRMVSTLHDSKERIESCTYQWALSLEQEDKYDDTIKKYQSVTNYKEYLDIPERITVCIISKAKALMQKDSTDEWAKAKEVLLPISNDARAKAMLNIIDDAMKDHYGFFKNLTVYRDETTNKAGLMDQNGNLLSDVIFDGINCDTTVYAPHFTEGLCKVLQDGKIGYIDITGRLVIPCQYKSAYDFNGGMALVRTQSGKAKLIDTHGTDKYNLTEDSSTKFLDYLGKSWLLYQSGRSCHLMNLSGTEVKKYYEDVLPFRGNSAIVKRYDGCGLISTSGNEIVRSDAIYSSFEYVTDDVLLFHDKNDNYGLISSNGQILKKSPMRIMNNSCFKTLSNGYFLSMLSLKTPGIKQYIVDSKGNVLTDRKNKEQAFSYVSMVSPTHRFAASTSLDGTGIELYRIEGTTVICISKKYKSISVGENSGYYVAETNGGLQVILDDNGDIINR